MAEKKYRTAPVSSTKMPRGIPYIIGNEAAERFSFYGMRTILVVFMTKYLMDHTGKKDLMTGEEAKTYFHLFVASAYFFPIIGAILSDWLLGKYKTIMSLSIVYCLGHLALALDDTRLGLSLGLMLIAIGSGGIKPCVSAHVGDQFGKKNEHLVSKVFSGFYFAINLGAFISTWMTPELLKNYGPNVAFGVPGGLMLLATWVFWFGRRKFVHIPAGGSAIVKEAFSGEGLRAIRNLAMVFLAVSIFWCVFDQTGSAWVLQARRMDLNLLGVKWLPSQIQMVNPILILAFIPLFALWIYPAIDKVFPLTPLRKVSIGFFIAGAAVTIPAWIESEITGADIVRPFKLDIGDKGTIAPSEADDNRWPIENILDGKTDGSGWYSSYRFDSVDFSEYDESKVKEGLFPQQIAIRLREGRSWKIIGVKINPYTSKKFFDDNSKDAKRSLDRQLKFAKRELEDEPEEEKKTLLEQLDSKYNRIVKRLESTEENAQKCWARELEVFVSDTRVGPWKSVGTLNLSPSKSTQELIFKDGPVDAEFVMIKILSHGGGDFVSLGELEVIADNADPPADAHAHAKEVWPNVAAIGHKPSILWQVFAYILLTASEIMISITCLEFAYTQAPRKIKSIIMSIYLLSVSLGNLIVSFVNYVIQNDDLSSKLDGPSYYWFFVGMVFITAFIFIPIAKFYKGQTYIQEDESGEDAEKTHT